MLCIAHFVAIWVLTPLTLYSAYLVFSWARFPLSMLFFMLCHLYNNCHLLSTLRSQLGLSNKYRRQQLWVGRMTVKSRLKLVVFNKILMQQPMMGYLLNICFILLDKFTSPWICKEYINPLSLRYRPNLYSGPKRLHPGPAVTQPHRGCMAMSPVTRRPSQSLGNLRSSSWSLLSNNTRRSAYDLWSYCTCASWAMCYEG